MRVCTKISDGLLIEAQSGGKDFNALKRNALNVGYKLTDIELKTVSTGEFNAILQASKANDPVFTAEVTRRAEHAAERAGMQRITLKSKTDWVRDRLSETTLDNPTKIALGKVFKKIVSFLD